MFQAKINLKYFIRSLSKSGIRSVMRCEFSRRTISSPIDGNISITYCVNIVIQQAVRNWSAIFALRGLDRSCVTWQTGIGLWLLTLRHLRSPNLILNTCNLWMMFIANKQIIFTYLTEFSKVKFSVSNFYKNWLNSTNTVVFTIFCSTAFFP